MKPFDVVIIGGGVLGASTFFHLCEAGMSVCLIEQNTPGSGVTAYSGGVVRAFHLDNEQLQQAVYSLNYFRQFDKRVGKPVEFVEQGFLYFPAPEDIQACKQSVGDHGHGIISRWLEAEEITARFPFVERSELHGAVWESKAGYIDPVNVTKSWIVGGQQLGGTAYVGCRVIETIKTAGSVTGVNTNFGQISGKAFVLAGGVNSCLLLKLFDIELPVYNKTIQVDLYKTQRSNLEMPCFVDAEHNLNGRGDEHYILQGMTCPDGAKYEEASVHQQVESQKMASKRFKWSQECSIVGSYCSLDTYSDRAGGYAGYVDRQRKILLLAGFNGTAFKFAPYLGQCIQQLILNDSGDRAYAGN